MPKTRPSGHRVSVVVPVRHGGVAFERCLDSLDRLDPAPGEVVVVVDGTDDRADPRDAARAHDHGATVIALPHRRGPGAARNEGVVAASGDVLLFADADVALAPDAVGIVLEELGARPEVSAIFGAYDDHPAEPGFTSQYKNLLNHLMHGAESEASTFWAGCGAVRRSAFAEVGGFDERFERPEMEDVELGARLAAAHRRIRIVPRLGGTHLKRWTPRKVLRTDLRERAIPWSLLILRTGQLPGELDVSTRHRVQVALVGVAGLCVAAGLRWRAAPLVALPAIGAVLVLEAPLLRGLARLRGPVFAVRAAPWRVTAYGISGLGLCLAAGQVAAERLGLLDAPVPRLRTDLGAGASDTAAGLRGAAAS